MSPAPASASCTHRETADEAAAYILDTLLEMSSAPLRLKMAAFGINTAHAFGVSVKDLRLLARQTGKDTTLARSLWTTGRHEARILAALVMRPAELSPEEMDSMAADFDSWDLCDIVCGELAYHPLAHEKVFMWTADKREFVRRAGFSLIARLAMRDKKSPDADFIEFLAPIKQYSADPRPMVRKAVDWALRQIGKRSLFLHRIALEQAREMSHSDDKNTRWVGSTAMRELSQERIMQRLADKKETTCRGSHLHR